MYRHNVSSIKETDDKIFISQADKDKYDSYVTVKRDISDTYTRTEIDELVKQTDGVKTTVTSTNSVIVLDNKYSGNAKVLTLKGNTIQDAATFKYDGVGEKISDDQYLLTIKSINGGNLLNLEEQTYRPNKLCVLYTETYNTITERYGERGLKVTAKDPNVRSCSFIRVPNYPIDLYVKIDVIGRGQVSVKDLNSVPLYFPGALNNQTFKYRIPANSGLLKIELDAGGPNSEAIVNYDNIIISTFEHVDKTHWEEYQEDSIDIISPVQLHGGNRGNSSRNEKISDQLVVKDGKLYVEKKYKTFKINDLLDDPSTILHIFDKNLYEDRYRINIAFEHGTLLDTELGDFYKRINLPEGQEYYLCDTKVDIMDTTNTTGAVKDFLVAEYWKHPYEPQHSKLYLFAKISKSKIDLVGIEDDTESYKKRIVDYIKSLNGTVTLEYYKDEYIELVDISKLSLKTFKNTVIDVESSVKPSEISVSVDTDMAAVLSTNISEIEMLNKEIENINNLSQEVSIDVTMKEHTRELKTVPSLIDGIEIEGKTYVNVLPPFNQYIFSPNYISIVNGNLIFSRDKAEADHTFIRMNANKRLKRLKPGTTYTLVARVIENTTDAFIICDNGGANRPDWQESYMTFNQITIRNKKTGVIATTIQTKETITDEMCFAMHMPGSSTGTIVFSSIELYEGNIVDKVNMIAGSADIQSVGHHEPIKITPRSSRNLFTNDYIYGDLMFTGGGFVENTGHGKGNICSLTYIPIDPKSTYFISVKEPEDQIGKLRVKLRFYDLDKKCIENESITSNVVNMGGRLTFKKSNGNVAFMRIAISAEDDTTELYPSYETIFVRMPENDCTAENEYNSVSIDLTKYGIEGGLKSLPDGKRDRIYKKNGKYYIDQVAGYVKLTGDIDSDRFQEAKKNPESSVISVFIYNINRNPDMMKPMIPSTPGVIGNLYTSYLPAGNVDSTAGSIYVDKASSQCVSLCTWNPELRIAVLKSELETDDIEGFKKWLTKIGGLEVVYEIDAPRTIEIEEDLDLMLYEGSSEISIESGRVTPVTKFKVHNHMQNTISSLMKKVDEMEEKQISKMKLLLDSTYSSDYSIHKTMLMNSRVSIAKETDEELVSIIKDYILSNDFDREKLEEQIDLFTMIDKIDIDTSDMLFNMISELRDITNDIGY